VANAYAPGVARPIARPAFRLPTLSSEGLRRFVGRPTNLIGALILLPIVLAAVFAPVLPLPDANAPDVRSALQAPSPQHWFGTDKLGRDILSRSVQGARISLLIGFSVAAIALLVGITVGMLSVFLGKTVDSIVMGATDLLLSFPSLLLAISFVAVFGAGLQQVIIAIVLSDIPRAVRLQRSLALGLQSRAYIDAARVVSAPTCWIVFRHVFPNTIAPMLVVASTYAANAILAEAALSFLGLGIVPPQASWGNIISDGRRYLQEAWWICTFPGLAIVMAAISLHLMSDGIRQVLDPRQES
jgi:peptide/nickel transport system permease protein